MSLPKRVSVDPARLIFDYKTLYFLANGTHLKDVLIYTNGWFTFYTSEDGKYSYRLADFEIMMRNLKENAGNVEINSPLDLLAEVLEGHTRPI